jgi:hypothetical protein
LFCLWGGGSGGGVLREAVTTVRTDKRVFQYLTLCLGYYISHCVLVITMLPCISSILITLC